MDFFNFDRMLTPVLIRVLYWLLLLMVLIVSIAKLWQGPLWMGVISAIVTFVVGCIAVRVWCELMIVIFKINDNLQVIRARSDPPAG